MPIKRTALTIALLLLLVSVIAIVFASSMLSNSVTSPNVTEPANETEQWSTPTRITSKRARGLCMSADGKRIAFLSGYDLFFMNSDGTGLKQLTNYKSDGLRPNSIHSPSISSNGGKIAFKASKAVGSGPPLFYHDDYSAIFVVNSDGTGLTRLFPNPKILDYEHLPEFQHTISKPFISGDGRKIAFVSDSELFVVNSDGTRLTLLSGNAAGDPSISSDGGKIAFSAKVGNYSGLFVINSDGTGLTRVVSKPLSSSGSHSIGALCISGDGGKIAFNFYVQWYHYLYVVNSDGTGLTKLYYNVTGTPSISYDGSRIAFISRESNWSYNIYVVNSDGTGLTLISSNAENYSGPCISGDGRKIIFSYGSEYGTFVSELGKELDTPEPTATPVQNNHWSTTQIMSLPSLSHITGLCMSADGSKIAFSVYNGGNDTHVLYVINSDGTGLTKLSNNIEEQTHPSISGDGGKIAFISGTDLYLINSDGTGLTKLVSNVCCYYSPSVSGDGSKVAVVVQVDHRNRDLYVVNSDGTGLTKLSSDVIHSPAISWDGSKIAFTYYAIDSDELAEIFVVNSDGTGLTQLTSKIGAFPYVTGPVISGDGSKVAVTVKKDRWDVDSYTEILVVNSDGTGLKQLTSNTWNDYVYSINYDGSKIAFVSGSRGNSEICVIDSDGTGLTQITENLVDDRSPSISGDGSKIAFYEGFLNTGLFVAVHK